MANITQNTYTRRTPVQQRISANMPVQASWVDEASGEMVSVSGVTENVGESSLLVNLEFLPPVGSSVTLRLMDEDRVIVEAGTEVIRIERDPSKPLAALNVVENEKQWKTKSLSAAQSWVTRNWKLNYEDEWIN